jgi:hypothetical protein
MARHVFRLVGLFLIASLATASAAANVEPKPAYDLTVEGDRVSLRVSEGRLLEVVEDLGRQLGFEVVATSVDNLRISTEFQDLPSREAIRKICETVGYVEVPDPNTGRIMRLVVTGGGGANRLEPRRDPLPQRREPAPQIAPKPLPPKEEPKEDKQDDENSDDRG